MMKKKRILILLGLAAALTAAGCGNSEKTTETQAPAAASADQADADESADTESIEADETDIPEADAETEPETEAALDPITPSEYLVENISDYATLGDVAGLEVTQYNYEITDDLVQDTINTDLASYAEETEVDRASAEGDVVYTEMTYSIQGEEDSESSESTYFNVGEEEYGAEFDSKITGVSAGDTVTFSITFDDEVWVDEWVDQTVDFQLDITSVCEVELPEYNDDFVATYTDYSSMDEYEASIRQELESEYNESSRYEAVETLFEAAAEQTVFSGYPQELYDQCKQELLSFYSIFTGSTDEDEIYEMFDITAEDFDLEIVDSVNRRLLVNAICKENGLDVTEDEYVAYITDLAENYGYDSAAEFEEENSREALVWELFDAKAGDYLYENAVVTEETADPDDEEDWDEAELDLEEDTDADLDEEEISADEIDLGEDEISADEADLDDGEIGLDETDMEDALDETELTQ